MKLRWLKNWIPGERNTLQCFEIADEPWARDENHPEAWRSSYEWNARLKAWGTWEDVPVEDL